MRLAWMRKIKARALAGTGMMMAAQTFGIRLMVTVGYSTNRCCYDVEASGASGLEEIERENE